MQLLSDSQDILLKFPDFSRVSLTIELIPWLFQGFQDHSGLILEAKFEDDSLRSYIGVSWWNIPALWALDLT